MTDIEFIITISFLSALMTIVLIVAWTKTEDGLRDWKHRREAKARKDAEQDARLANLER